jgi:hypothetical protein
MREALFTCHVANRLESVLSGRYSPDLLTAPIQ